MVNQLLLYSRVCLCIMVFLGIYALVYFASNIRNTVVRVNESISRLNNNVRSTSRDFWRQQGHIITNSTEGNNSFGIRPNDTRTKGVNADKLSFLTNNTGVIEDRRSVEGIPSEDGEIVYDDYIQIKTVRRIHDILYKKPTHEQCHKRLPKCILIGIYKCGTRELYDFMGMHPNIVPKDGNQEYNVFHSHQYQQNDMNRSIERLRDQMPCSYSDQVSLIEYPEYFKFQDIPEILYNYDRGLKMILLVREPVQRLISHVWFTNKKTTHLDTYMDSKVLRSASGEINVNERLVELSVYDEPMVRYLRYFQLNQILIIEAKELQKKPVSVLSRIESFLGVPHVITDDLFVYNKQKGFYCINSPEGKAICYSKIRGRKYNMDIFPETKQKLLNYYKPHNEKFFKLIGHRFDW